MCLIVYLAIFVSPTAVNLIVSFGAASLLLTGLSYIVQYNNVKPFLKNFKIFIFAIYITNKKSPRSQGDTKV